MQMFNGISMSALKFGKMFFNHETTSTPADSQESFDNPQNEQLKKIKKEIDELTDSKSEGSLDTDNDKIDVQWVLNREFAEFLKNNSTTAESLYKAVSELNFESIKDNKVKSSNEEVKTKLISFLEPIVHPVNIEQEQEFTGLNSNKWNFYEKNLDKGKDAITKETIVGKINDIFKLIWENEAHWESENIKKYRNTIKNIKQVLENPNPDNTKPLQKFILANLDKNKEPYDDLLMHSFKKKNPDDPDWLFGQATLNWVHAFLLNLESHIKNIKAAESIMKNNESIESSVDLKELTVKETIKLSDKIEASALIDNFDKLQDKVEVTFKEDKWIDQLNKSTTSQEVIVVIKSKDWKQTREITINATISGDEITLEENTTWKLDGDKKTNTSETKSNPVDTKPYESVDGKKYQVMENNAKLVESTKINWATFYFPESKQDVPQNGDGTWETAPDKLVWQEREFYLKLSNKSDLYKVKVDAQWNLYPIMEENKPEGKRILIKNNESCVNYLLNKLPPTLRWSSVKIMWDGEDYVIWKDWYRKWLTIEPMTIDWKWLSAGWESKTSLADSLAFLNFTNFLRNEGEIYGIEFRNNNPDLRIHENELYVRVNRKSNKEESKRNWEKKGELWWKWQKVDLNSFWLPAVENPAFQNFIKYNNHEDWNDNWDKKRDNKEYGKIDLKQFSTPQSIQQVYGWKNNSNSIEWSRSIEWSVGSDKSIDFSNITSTLGLSEVPDFIEKNVYNVPESASIFKDNSWNLYYVDNKNIVSFSENTPWLKKSSDLSSVLTGGQSLDNLPISLNVCEKWMEKMNERLEDLNLGEDELKNLSLEMSNSEPKQYLFCNWDVKLPVPEILPKEWFVNEKLNNELNLLYLSSKNIPGKFVYSDGWIKDGENKDVITKDQLSEVWLDTEDKVNGYLKYLNEISESYDEVSNLKIDWIWYMDDGEFKFDDNVEKRDDTLKKHFIERWANKYFYLDESDTLDRDWLFYTLIKKDSPDPIWVVLWAIKSWKYSWNVTVMNGNYKYEWTVDGGYTNFKQWEMAFPNWYIFKWSFDWESPEEWHFQIGAKWYDIKKQNDGRLIIKWWEDSGKYIDMKTWKILDS